MGRKTMPIQIGRPPDHGLTEPLGLLGDCHRRIEYFLDVLISVTDRTAGGPLTPAQRAELTGALAYFATASPTHTARRSTAAEIGGRPVVTGQ